MSSTMSLPGKLLIAIAVGLVAAASAPLLPGVNSFNPFLAGLFVIATVGTALVTHRPLAGASRAAARTAAKTPGRKAAGGKKAPARKQSAPARSGPRKQATVKWFNAAKGFGFLTLDDGQEIFVHFRSIRGEGRRSLRDGQRVSFIMAETDKGPQAEDVDPID